MNSHHNRRKHRGQDGAAAFQTLIERQIAGGQNYGATQRLMHKGEPKPQPLPNRAERRRARKQRG